MEKTENQTPKEKQFISYRRSEPKIEVPSAKKTPAPKLWLQILANLFILAGILYLFLWSLPIIVPFLSYNYNRLRGVRYEISTEPPSSTEKKTLLEQLKKPLEPLKVVPVSTDFGLVIEKINVNAPVVPEVDAGNEQIYAEALKQGVAHAEGTNYPGENGNCYLFSHSTFNVLEIGKYNAVFTLLNELIPGDRIVVFYKGERFDYEVYEKKVVKPEDISPLTAEYAEPVLTLQTCDPPGTNFRRLIITAKLKV